jgi:glutathione synthase/RimK-type ligase-like ATP-grasp enzyme
VSFRTLVYFATYADQPEITDDDRVLAAALGRRGAAVRAAPWDDVSITWSEATAVIVRSTWNYHHRRAEFLSWTELVAEGTQLYNTPATIRWNSHKGYLAALAARDVPVIDTVFAEAGSATDVAAVATQHHWHDLVIKPAVSASAHETFRFRATEHDAAQAHLDRLLASGDAMLQPHLDVLGQRGELALMFIAGRFTHAVRRRSALAAEGSMPRSAPAEAAASAVGFAERVLQEAALLMAANEMPLYARVDLAETPTKGHRLLELELIEPSLFFLHAPEAAESMADAITSRL